jgi:hypothetical protein
MRRVRLALAALALAGLVAGCSTVVTGAGSVAASPGAAVTGCPHVVFPSAKLSFHCIASGMTTNINGPVWPLAETKTVEADTGWVFEEGAGHWGAQRGQSLASIARTVRQRMIDAGSYGTDPGVDTVADKSVKVGGVAAHLLQTTFTINPAWAKTAGTKVKHEKLWIIALQVGPDEVSLWYTSLPDLVRSLWAKVPSIIATIKVS